MDSHKEEEEQLGIRSSSTRRILAMDSQKKKEEEEEQHLGSDGDEYLPRHFCCELLERFVASFPNVADVARCGLVSKTWYTIVHSPSFWQLRSSSSTASSSCLLLRPSKFLPPPQQGLDESRPWFAYLPNEQRWTSMCGCVKPGSYHKMTTSRGLICAKEQDSNVLVFNPLTNSCTTLPYDELLTPPAHGGGYSYFQLSFGVDPVTLSYIVVIFHFWNYFFNAYNFYSCSPVLYDSKTKSWTRGKTVPQPQAVTTPQAPVPALRGSFYFLAYDGTSIVRYHARTDCWSTMRLRPPVGIVVSRSNGDPACLRTRCPKTMVRKTLVVFPSLVESMGRLLLVGGYEAANGLQQTLCIWELKENEEEAASTQELAWKAVELTSMPQELWFDFISMQEGPEPYVTPAGAGDVICFYNKCDDRILPYLCNLSTNSWYKVPAFPGFSTEDQRYQQVVVFEPRLDSLA